MRRPTPTVANVLSVLALFVAIGGTSYAAVTVTGKNVKNSSLTGADVRSSSLTTSDVKNGSLLARDFRSGQLPRGRQGGSGPPGPQGGAGPRGEPGISGYQELDHFSSVNSQTPKAVTSPCPEGMKVIGGGAFISVSGPIAVKTSVPLADGTGWTVEAYETAPDDETWTVDARAICAKVAS